VVNQNGRITQARSGTVPAPRLFSRLDFKTVAQACHSYCDANVILQDVTLYFFTYSLQGWAPFFRWRTDEHDHHVRWH
jgi:hypothetical protein